MDDDPRSVSEYIAQIKIDLMKLGDAAQCLLTSMNQCENRRIKILNETAAALTLLASNADAVQKMSSVEASELNNIRTLQAKTLSALEECVGYSETMSRLMRGVLRHCDSAAYLCELDLPMAEVISDKIAMAIRSTFDRITFIHKEAFKNSERYCSELETIVKGAQATQTNIALPQGDTVEALAADLTRFKNEVSKPRIAALGTPFNRQFENLKTKLTFASQILETMT